MKIKEFVKDRIIEILQEAKLRDKDWEAIRRDREER